MSGALQAVFQNQRSFVLPLAIGDAYEGGYFAGQISTAGNGIADYNLVIGPKSSAQSSTTLQAKTAATTTAGTSSVIDGPANSTAMNNASHPAAQFCEAVNTGGFTDWYMPAKNELEILYFNLKPTTATNLTTTGGNTNAVPSRGSFYTAGTPAQTAAAAFQTGGAEALNANGYWSSTESPVRPGNEEGQYFSDGSQFDGAKTNTYRVRAVRRVAV